MLDRDRRIRNARHQRRDDQDRRHSQRDDAGARDEKIQARKKKDLSPEEARKHQEMEKLYRQHVLKEAPSAPVIQIQGLKKAKQEEVTH
jgi:hypothetical protein